MIKTETNIFSHDNFVKTWWRKEQNNEVSKADFAKFLDITPQFAGQIIAGSKEPGRDTALLIADYLNVSLDYLYGRTNVESPDASVRAAAELTGLSEELIQILAYYRETCLSAFINEVLLSNYKEIDEVLIPNYKEVIFQYARIRMSRNILSTKTDYFNESPTNYMTDEERSVWKLEDGSDVLMKVARSDVEGNEHYEVIPSQYSAVYLFTGKVREEDKIQVSASSIADMIKHVLVSSDNDEQATPIKTEPPKPSKKSNKKVKNK